MQTPVTFGAWLRQRRRALDFTRERLARDVGCAPNTITKIEANLRRPSRQIAERLMDALAVSAAQQPALLQWARGAPAAMMLEQPAQHVPVPSPLTPLFGRAADVDAVIARILRKDTRLLTLHGPPGVGKTRLSLELAARLASVFPGGAPFVALATIHDPALVLDTIAHALGVQEQAGTSVFERLVAAMQDQPTLLILDNFEQIVAAGSHIAALLTHCARLKIVVTSRERLHVRGERVIAVPPLALPSAETTDLDEIAGAPAVALFVETAQAVRPDFHLAADNIQDVAALCARLDGLPLAIEIVAAQCAARTPAMLLAEFRQRLLGSGGQRDLPSRQRTLRAALDWSHKLLAPAEQQVFMRLSVLVGGWTFADAVAMCGEALTLDDLESLTRKSLLQHHRTASGELLFFMLETVREYAAEQLDLHDTAQRARQQHAAYYLALAEQAAPQLTGAEQTHWLAQLTGAHDNMLAALAWLLDADDAERAGRLAVALRRFWWMRGMLRLGRLWVGRVLAHESTLTPDTRARLYITEGWLASGQGDFSAGNRLFETGVRLARTIEDRTLLSLATHSLGSNLVRQGEYAAAQVLIEEALAHDRELGDPWQVAISLGTLAELFQAVGDYVQAQPLYWESLTIYRAFDDQHSIMVTLNNLGELAHALGNLIAAHAHLEEAATIAQAHGFLGKLPYMLNNLGMLALLDGDRMQARQHVSAALAMLCTIGDRQELATSFVVCAALALDAGEALSAAHLLGATAALRALHRVAPLIADADRLARLVSQAQARLGAATFDAAWDAGQRMSATEATQLARDIVQQPARSDV